MLRPILVFRDPAALRRLSGSATDCYEPSMNVAARALAFAAVMQLSHPAAAETSAEEPPSAEQAGEEEPTPERSREEEPLWEIGLVGGGGWLPDYPASDQNHINGIVLPYAIYRGDFFRIGDGEGPRGLFVDNPWLELNVGVDAAFPVDSDDNDAREGMDDLDYLLEAGPKLIVKLLPSDPLNEVDLSVALRGVFSTDFSNLRYQGLTLNPGIAYRRNEVFGTDLEAIASLTGIFGFDGYNDYFYEVGEQDVRDDRPRFRANQGYVGSEITLGLSWGVTERVRVFGGTQIGIWSGSANEDSPLFRDETTLAVGGGLRWTFLASEERVARKF